MNSKTPLLRRPIVSLALVFSMLMAMSHCAMAGGFASDPEFRAQADKVCALMTGASGRIRFVLALKYPAVPTSNGVTTNTFDYKVISAQVDQKGVLQYSLSMVTSRSTKYAVSGKTDEGKSILKTDLSVPLKDIVNVSVFHDSKLNQLQQPMEGSGLIVMQTCHVVQISSSSLKGNEEFTSEHGKLTRRKWKGDPVTGIAYFEDEASARKLAEELNTLIAMAKKK